MVPLSTNGIIATNPTHRLELEERRCSADSRALQAAMDAHKIHHVVHGPETPSAGGRGTITFDVNNMNDSNQSRDPGSCSNA